MTSKFSTNALKELAPYKAASQDIWKEDSNTKLKLDWNEGVVKPPKIVTDSLNDFLDKGMFNFYPNTQNKDLLNSISNYISCKESNISYFSGIDHLHEYIVRAFLNEGDKVSILTPTYDNFRAVCESSGIKINKIDYYSESNDLYKLSNFDSKVVYFANPNNPTGHIIDTKVIKNWLINNPDTLFVIDEAYIEFSGVSSKNFINEFNNILICRTLSKAFCLAGIRFGYCLSSESIINSLNSIRNPKSVSMFSQILALAALNNLNYVSEYVNKNNNAKNILKRRILEKFQNVKLSGDHGNFLLLRFSSKQDCDNFIEYLKSIGISIRDTQHLVPNSCRVTIPVDEGLDLLLKSIDEVE